MPSTPPPAVVLRELLGPTTRHTRRVEIYEQDGVTRWAKDTATRLLEGSISVDYSRDERRSLDLTLDNADRVLINAPGEFWYDKIIKVYRGVRVREAIVLPKILVIADGTGVNSRAVAFRAAMVAVGFDDIRVNTLAAVSTDLIGYDIIVALSTGKSALIEDAYLDGKTVFTAGSGTDWLFGIFGAKTTGTGTTGLVSPFQGYHPVQYGWSAFTSTGEMTLSGYEPYVSQTILAISYAETVVPPIIQIGALEEPVAKGKGVIIQYTPSNADYALPEFRNLLRQAFNWLNPVITIDHWEVQIGEFMIDRISEPNFPHTIKITGRDYTKKCLLSKFTQATQFDPGLELEAIVRALAANAGITKMTLPTTGITVGRTFFYERGVSRWEAMKEIATAYDYEIFFDANGSLVLRLFNDPVLTPPVFWIETGAEGSLASYEKSTADTRIYNHIVVTGESSDAAVIPVFAEAKNEVVGSPTSIVELGDRLFTYTSSFIVTTEQAQSVADSFLKIHALEEFELSFDSLMLPWLEGGDILGWIDPNPAEDDPTTFLLSSLTIPLTLGPMSGSGKRVISIASGGTVPQFGASWDTVAVGTTWNAVEVGLSWLEA